MKIARHLFRSFDYCRSIFTIAVVACALASLVTELPKAAAATLPATDELPCYLLPEGLEYSAEVPSPRDYLGFEIGELHVRHHQLVGYLRQLADKSERMTYEEIGQTHGRRPLVSCVITSPENHARLEEIRAAHLQLADPTQADSVDLKDLPAVIYMGYAVHGDEPSGANSVPAVAYYLTAGQGPELEALLQSTVILLDPCLNPDGFDRFAAHANSYVGRTLNADASHFEHTQPWPGGRVNYYWFDLNRDWLPTQHPESQARINLYHQWKPNVVLDFHEMGTGSTFFFQPGVPNRTNPLTPKRNVELTKQIGSYHARALDDIGSIYFTEENFDDFYMGKGSTYPDLHGSIGILFEQASSRGHIQESDNGEVAFPFTIRNQFTCSLSSLQATFDLRTELLEYKRQFYRDSNAAGRADRVEAYAFTAPGDQTRLLEFARILQGHDIECGWLNQPLDVRGETLPAGSTLVVPTNQPEYRFLLSLIERRTEFRESIFYDVSAWTLPLAFDLNAYAIDFTIDEGTVTAERPDEAYEVTVDENVVAVVLPWTDYSSPRVLYQLLDADIKVRVAAKPFASLVNGELQEFGYGTLVIPFGIQELAKTEVLKLIEAARPTEVFPIETGLTPQGIDLGSNQFTTLKKPKALMPIDGGARRYTAGEVWHLLDTRINMPLTLLASERFSRTDLDDYNVIILADGSYSEMLSGSNGEKLSQWLRGGGTVIAIGSAIQSLNQAGLVNVEFEESNDESEEATSTTEDSDLRQKSYASARDERALDLISGTIFHAQVDVTHPLGYGFTDSSLPVFRTNRIFLSPSENPYANPVIYTDDPLLGGYVSEENLEVLKRVASVRVESAGRGRVILMSDNPNFRAFWYGSNRLFFNSLFFGQLVDVP